MAFDPVELNKLVIHWDCEKRNFVVRKDGRIVFFSPSWDKAREYFTEATRRIKAMA